MEGEEVELGTDISRRRRWVMRVAWMQCALCFINGNKRDFNDTGSRKAKENQKEAGGSGQSPDVSHLVAGLEDLLSENFAFVLPSLLLYNGREMAV